MSLLLASLGTSIANVGLPTLAKAFHANFQEVQWVVLAYLIAITALIVGAGKLGDRFGRRRLLLTGISIFTVASVAAGSAPSLAFLVGARALQGAGAALMMSLAMALVGDAVPKAKAGSAIGLLGTMSAAGTALGPTLGGVLIASAGWPAIFCINLPLGLLALWLAWRYLPADAPLATARQAGKPGMVSMLRNPAIWPALAMSALVTAVVMATLVVGPFYLSGELGLDAAALGLVLSTGPLAAALTGVPAGLAVDRWGARRMTKAGLAAMAVGSAALPVAASSLGVAGYIGALGIITSGYALFQTANNTALMVCIDANERGVVSGLAGLARNLGLITGASLLGAVYTLGGLPATFGACLGLVMMALLIARRQNAATK